MLGYGDLINLNRQFRWTLTKQARVTQADLWNVSSFISDEKIALNLALLHILKYQPKFFNNTEASLRSLGYLFIYLIFFSSLMQLILVLFIHSLPFFMKGP